MSEHYPVRQVIDVGGLSDGYPATVTATKERVFCGCTEAYDFDYGHEETALSPERTEEDGQT